MNIKIYEKKQKHKLTLVEFLLCIAFLGFILNIVIGACDDRIHSRRLDKLSCDRYDSTKDAINIDTNYIANNFDFEGDWYCPGYPKQYRINIRLVNSRLYQFSIIVYYKNNRYIKRYGNIDNGIMILDKPIERRSEFFLRLIPVTHQDKYYLLPSTKYKRYVSVGDKDHDEMMFLLLYKEPIEIKNL
jgi:hypothetical protein